MQSQSKTFWTLTGQLRVLIILSGLTVILLALLGGWRLQQFTAKNHELQQTSRSLRRDLASNFENARLLTEIQTDLHRYMRSAHPGALHTIHTLAETLRSGLPDDLKPELTDFLQQLAVLEIRMNSFRQNNESLFAIEREIVQSTDALLDNIPLTFRAEVRKLSSHACLKHHHLYKNVILTDDSDSLQITSQEYEQLFAHLEKEIGEYEKKLPQTNSPHLKTLQTAFYKLDESISTITAIRRVTQQTENEIKNTLASMREAVAENSLTGANVLASLTQSGLTFLRNNLLVMSAVIIAMALLGGISAFLLSQTMVKPLIGFSDMLKRMTRMLSGLRKESEFEEDFSTLLDSMTDRRNDEIGQVASAVKQLLLRLRELAVFRQDIEADESTEEIYQRMGRIFSQRLNLTSFVIFELSQDGNIMQPVFKQITVEGVELPEVSLTDECRAWRNNRIISSIKDSHTCSLFPAAGELRHVCIPLQISGQVLGLVQFLFAPDIVEPDSNQATEALVEARHYIAEAMPVLHAKRLTHRLQIMATEDPLTGLFNRRYLETSLDRLVAGIRRHAGNIVVIMCDLDHFKKINDTYGHGAGDEVLIQLSRIFLNNVRETDLVIRHGGEEFMILLLNCDPIIARRMAERIRRQVQEYKFHFGSRTARLTISLGTAEFTHAMEEDIRDIFNCADIALYQAKENGRNRVVHYDDSNQTSSSSR